MLRLLIRGMVGGGILGVVTAGVGVMGAPPSSFTTLALICTPSWQRNVSAGEAGGTSDWWAGSPPNRLLQLIGPPPHEPALQ